MPVRVKGRVEGCHAGRNEAGRRAIEAGGTVGGQTEPGGTEVNRHQESGLRGGDAAAKACKDYKVQLDERGIGTAELEGETANATEKLRAEMDELRRQGNEQRIGFELQLVGVPQRQSSAPFFPTTTTTSRSGR